MRESISPIEQLEVAVDTFTFSGIAAGPPEGPLVLLLHGWPQFADSWSEIVRSLGADGYRAVAIDQRGYSVKARPQEQGAYSIDRLTGDVLAIADALQRPRFHLVTHDWGGIVGWFLAATRPERLATFTSFATPHPRALGEAIATDPDQRAKSAYVEFFRLPGGVAEKALLADDAARLRAAYQGKVAPDHVAQNVRRLCEPGALTATLNWYRAFDFKTPLGKVGVPTLYVWGSADVALGERAARATAGYLEGPYRFEILDGVTHWILDEAPDRATALIREQLSKGEL